MISIITGTLNRVSLLPKLIENTVLSNDKIELVLVDGGSVDGTSDYIKTLNHPRIKFLEVGGRSPYPHFMNLAIKNSTHELVCQWNDDVILCNDWDDVFSELDHHDFYLFNWKYGTYQDIQRPEWISGEDHTSGWCLLNNKPDGEIVMNYGIYSKKIFKEIGMYNNEYRYYCADGDMADRAYNFGYTVKNLRSIKVCSLLTNKVADHYQGDSEIYAKNLNLYKNKILPSNIELLK